MHLSLDEFRAKLPELLKRGFPPPDPTTGNYYLPEIDRWMAKRFKSAIDSNESDRNVISERIARL
jgi:hypothetical protein